MADVYNHEGEKVSRLEKLNPLSAYNRDKSKSKHHANEKREARTGQGTFKKMVTGLFSSADIFARYGASVFLGIIAFALAKDGFKQFLTPAFNLFSNELGAGVTKVKEAIPGGETVAALGHKTAELGGKVLEAVKPVGDAAKRTVDIAGTASAELYQGASRLDERAANTINPGRKTGKGSYERSEALAVRPETGACRAQMIQEMNKQRGITPQSQGTPAAGGASPQAHPGSTTLLPSTPGCD